MPEVIELTSLDPNARETLAARAAALLDEGELLVLPTETVYGIAASAARPNALGRLAAFASGVKRTITGKAVGPTGFTWHAPDRDAAVRALGISHRAHRRFFDRLTPGPVRILYESAPAGSVAGEIPGAFVTDGVLSLRLPDLDFVRDVLSQAKTPIAMDRVPRAMSRTGRSLDGSGLRGALESAGITLCIDAGPTRLGGISTAVTLTAAGGYRVDKEGAIDSKAIDRAMETVVLFVCSGNTCRSPMAESIARDLLEKAPPSAVIVRVASAGTQASDGAPATSDADRALAKMGVPPPRKPHRSRSLTAEMISGAEVVYAMTRAHREAILELVPEAAAKVELLDPHGQDIPDPIGAGFTAYTRAAEEIRSDILQRFAERRLLPGVDAKPSKPRAKAAGEKS